MKDRERLVAGARTMNVELSEKQVEVFMRFRDQLLERNKLVNLTAIREPEEVITKHFLDSLCVFATESIKSKTKVLDVGTGGGFPGIPMKIADPSLRIDLLDSLKKRLTFLDEVITENQWTDIQTLHGRAEDFAQNRKYREQYDLVVSRAVARLTILLEYCLPYVKLGGLFLALKGPMLDEEIDEAKRALLVLGGQIEKMVEVKIPYTDLSHRILVIKKIKSTPKSYPRQAGRPRKEPII
ncbi:16S rRNA (guanine(527)-N(7))-methyltransferase RsmG [Gottschalkiaceae bacterium SANA]|nr:16S rRNA (guanine(527)-N(7))-methyltransferase RsmG [Gottschalkiaceae bacterium SANA]